MSTFDRLRVYSWVLECCWLSRQWYSNRLGGSLWQYFEIKSCRLAYKHIYIYCIGPFRNRINCASFLLPLEFIFSFSSNENPSFNLKSQTKLNGREKLTSPCECGSKYPVPMLSFSYFQHISIACRKRRNPGWTDPSFFKQRSLFNVQMPLRWLSSILLFSLTSQDVFILFTVIKLVHSIKPPATSTDDVFSILFYILFLCMWNGNRIVYMVRLGSSEMDDSL